MAGQKACHFALVEHGAQPSFGAAMKFLVAGVLQVNFLHSVKPDGISLLPFE
jgi:hypothetical protein